MARPTIWLRNADGDVWNLRPRNLNEMYSSFFATITGTGFETELSVNRVNYDFIVTEEKPKQVPIKGKMYFTNPVNMRNFGEFLGDYSSTVKLYYDPEGKIDHRCEIAYPWYKEVKITQLTSGEQDKSGFLVCDMTFTPLSVMWRRDTTVASSVATEQGEALTYPFTYPYFYAKENRMELYLFNTGERIGCVVKVKNKAAQPLREFQWAAIAGTTRQYARWSNTLSVPPNATLIIDSNANTQKAVVDINGIEQSVIGEQEPNPQYINFVELLPGANTLSFETGTNAVEIEVSYTEQVRVL